MAADGGLDERGEDAGAGVARLLTRAASAPLFPWPDRSRPNLGTCQDTIFLNLFHLLFLAPQE